MKLIFFSLLWLSIRKYCPYSEFSWSVFSRILVTIFSHSDWQGQEKLRIRTLFTQCKRAQLHPEYLKISIGTFWYQRGEVRLLFISKMNRRVSYVSWSKMLPFLSWSSFTLESPGYGNNVFLFNLQKLSKIDHFKASLVMF